MGLALPLRPDDSAAFRRDSVELIKALRSLDDGMQWYAERTSPYPLAVTERDVAVYDRLYAAIATGIERVVQAYWSDARIRAILALPPPLLELLARTEGLAYRTGALRPDFLCDADGVFRICEVNARFPTNGFMCSYYTNEAVDGLAYLAGCPARSVPGLRRTLDVLTSRFRAGEPLVVLLDREQGTEVFLLVDELRRRGIDARCRRPAQLLVRGGRIVDGGDVVEQFILELERDELLDLPVDLFDALAASERSFNDVRTLLLGHDKRMLAVLSRPEIMVDHVGADERRGAGPPRHPDLPRRRPAARRAARHGAGVVGAQAQQLGPGDRHARRRRLRHGPVEASRVVGSRRPHRPAVRAAGRDLDAMAGRRRSARRRARSRRRPVARFRWRAPRARTLPSVGGVGDQRRRRSWHPRADDDQHGG